MSSRTIDHEIQQQAKAWIRCLHSGLSNDEKPQLIAWINQNPEHHRAIYQSASILDNISELNELNGIFPIEGTVGFRKKYAKQLITISIALFATLTYYFFFLSQLSTVPVELPTSYITKIGEVDTIKISIIFFRIN